MDKLEAIRSRIDRVAREGKLGKLVERVDVALDHYDDETDFLDVVIKLKSNTKGVDDDMISTIESVEEAVAEIDPRYPSVRFLDAA